jgi:hypothetical protein
MGEYHDLIVMCMTAGGLYGAIRFDLKFVKLNLQKLEARFESHLKKFHGE